LGLAEGVGFEPTVLQRRTTVFKTVTIGHSDTPPSTGSLYSVGDAASKGRVAAKPLDIKRYGKLNATSGLDKSLQT
jgi:hypothetical protein